MPQKNTLSIWQQHVYALPAMGTSFLIGSLGVMQGVYAKYYGLSLTTLASLILIANLFDAVTDPLIGCCSDRYYRRTGSRKPFVVTGGLLLIVSSFFLYAPVDLEVLKTFDTDSPVVYAKVSPMYFLGWYLAFYFSWTMFEIPHLAWGGELATQSQEKTKVFTIRAALAWAGILLFYVMPLLPVFETQDFTPEILFWAAFGVSFVMLPLLFLSTTVTPDSVRVDVGTHQEYRKESVETPSLVNELQANKPLTLFLIAMVFFNISVSGMWLTLLFIFVDGYLELGNKFSQVSLIGLCIGLPMLMVWYRLAIRWGKTLALVFGLTFSLIGTAGTGFLEPGNDSFMPLMVLLIFCFGIGGPALNCLAPSILSEIVDYGHWKYGEKRAATYFSLFSLTSKTAAAIGGSAGLAIAGTYSFDPASSFHSADGVFGLRLAISWIPTFLLLVAIMLIAKNPITRARHHTISRRIEVLSKRI